jgi:molybdate transport system substrate-binding protein
LKNRVMSGEPFDVIVVNSVAFDDLVKQGKFPAGSKVILAHSGIGVAVRAGAAKPDISTPEKFKQALLQAKSIIATDPATGGTSGVHFAKAIQTLGIADQIRNKMKLADGGPYIGDEVASGQYEIGIQQVGELLPVKGIEIIGEMPGDLNFVSYYATAVAPAARQPNAAKAFVQFITAPASAVVYKARGLELN